MGQDDQPRTAGEEGLHAGREALDPGGVGNPPVPDRHVQIGPDQQALAGYVHLVDARQRHQAGGVMAKGLRIVTVPYIRPS